MQSILVWGGIGLGIMIAEIILLVILVLICIAIEQEWAILDVLIYGWWTSVAINVVCFLGAGFAAGFAEALAFAAANAGCGFAIMLACERSGHSSP